MLNKLKSFIERNSGRKMVQTTGLRISTNDRIRQMIRHELFRQQINDEAETFDEADDFSLPDEEEWISPYEDEFEPDPTPPPADPRAVKDESPGAVVSTDTKPGQPAHADPENGQAS